jgi:hypothetical protein
MNITDINQKKKIDFYNNKDLLLQTYFLFFVSIILRYIKNNILVICFQ